MAKQTDIDSKVNFDLDLIPINNAIMADDFARAIALINDRLARPMGPAWRKEFVAVHKFLHDFVPFRTVLMPNGNSKLKFLSWSTLPGGTNCPGAGACWFKGGDTTENERTGFCYSTRAWRNATPWGRQLQNTVLQKHNPAAIIADLEKHKKRALKKGKRLDFRLFVDGDFDSVETIEFWFNYLAENTAWIDCYGYSKSFALLLEHKNAGGTIPSNYLLNISGGSNASAQLLADAAELPYTRGDFVAVQIPTKGKIDHADKAHQKALRTQYKALTGKSAFTCPGKCFECTTVKNENVHMCGSARAKNVDVIIAVH